MSSDTLTPVPATTLERSVLSRQEVDMMCKMSTGGLTKLRYKHYGVPDTVGYRELGIGSIAGSSQVKVV